MREAAESVAAVPCGANVLAYLILITNLLDGRKRKIRRRRRRRTCSQDREKTRQQLQYGHGHVSHTNTHTNTHTRHGSQCKAMVNWLENITDEGQHENPKLRIKAWEVLHGISELTDIFITEYLSCHLSFFFFLT